MSMADRDGVIWYDGKLVPWRDATTHVLTHTLHYGMGVFEGVRAYKAEQGTAIFRLQEHTDRLFRSAHILGMKMPFDKATISEAQRTVVRENKLESGYLRPMAFYGSEAMGISAKNLSVHVIVAAWPWGAYLGQEALEHGIRVKTSSFSRHHVNVTMCKAKANGNYMNSILAHREAEMDGYDEALLLDVDGFVAEGSGENIFIVRNGKLYTPDLDLRAGRHHPRHHHPAGRRNRPAGDRKAHHPRRGLHRRRGLLHRHRRRSHADPRTRQPRPSAKARAAPSPPSCRRCISTACTAAPPPTPTGSPRSNKRDRHERTGTTTPSASSKSPKTTCPCIARCRSTRTGMPTRASICRSRRHGEALCPYCGTLYRLKGKPSGGSH